jgi:hypothetical protein
MAQPTLCNLPRLLLYWCACFSPELALPLSVWLSSGWAGMLLRWRAESGAACLLGGGMRVETSEAIL